jgi:hypothetical protein
MFLPGCAKSSLKYNIGLYKALANVTFAQWEMEQLVGAQFCVYERGVWGQCCMWVRHSGQVFVVNLDVLCSIDCGLFVCCYNQGYFIPLETYHIFTQDWLIGINQTKAVVRYIGGGQNSNYAGQAQGLASINSKDASMWTPGEHDLEMVHLWFYQVGRVMCCPSNFTSGIWAWQRFTNDVHTFPPDI